MQALRLRPKFLEFLAPELLADRDFILAAAAWQKLGHAGHANKVEAHTLSLTLNIFNIQKHSGNMDGHTMYDYVWTEIICQSPANMGQFQIA